MEKKHTAKIVFLYVLMGATTFGQLVENYLQLGTTFDEAGLKATVYTICALAINSAIMMAIPFLVRIIKKSKLSHKNGKWLCLCNSVGLYVASVVSLVFFSFPFVTPMSAIIFYFINKWTFVSDYKGMKRMSKKRVLYCRKCGAKIEGLDVCYNCVTQVVEEVKNDLR